MPFQFIALVPKLAFIAGFVAKRLKDPTMRAFSLDEFSQALKKSNEGFLELFENEYNAHADFKTLLSEDFKKSVWLFMHSETVQLILSESFSDGDTFRIADMESLWTQLQDPAGNKLASLPSAFQWHTLKPPYLSLVRRILGDNASLRLKWAAHNTQEIKSVLKEIKGPSPKISLDDYRQALIDEFATLKLSHLQVEYDPQSRNQAAPLQRIYVNQQVKEAFPPRDVSRDYRRKLEDRSLRQASHSLADDSQLVPDYERVPVRPLYDILQDNCCTRLVILGDPGLGKSTLLQHLALNWAYGSMNPVPFFIELRKYTRDHSRPKSFPEFIEKGTWFHCSLSQGHLDQMLSDTDCLVLFDGLDEVFDPILRGNIVNEIIRFNRTFPRARIIVTTRVIGYAIGSPNPENFQRAGFRQFTLQDFGPSEISLFIDKWYDNVIAGNEPERDLLKQRLSVAIKEFPSMRELAGNPLLLTMMALLNRKKHLPRERIKLYESCAELLVEGWDAARHLEPSQYLGHEDKIEILQKVAFDMQHEREGLSGNMISDRRLKRIMRRALHDRNLANPGLKARKIVEALAERDFMLCFIGDQQFAFVHRSFLEYFCAKEYKAHLENAGSPEELVTLFADKWKDDSWHEVLRLICAMVGPDLAGTLVGRLSLMEQSDDGWRAIFLAADCLAEIRQLGRIETVRETVHAQLISLLEFRDGASSAFRGSTEDRTVEVRKGALIRLSRGWPDESTRTLLKKAACHRYWAVRFAAVEQLSRTWRDRHTREYLMDAATNSRDWSLRQAAVHGLATEWKDDISRELLIRCVDEDSNTAVRATALRELSAQWPTFATRKWVSDKSMSSEDPSTRMAANEELARRWPDNESREWLYSRVMSDFDIGVREITASVIAATWFDPESKSWFLECAANSKNENARLAVLFALCFYWKDEPVKVLLAKLSEDMHPSIRSAAVSALVHFPGDHGLLAILYHHGQTDHSPDVRASAMSVIGNLGHNESSKILFKASKLDRSPKVREKALEGLIVNYDNDQVRAHVLSCLASDPSIRLRQNLLSQLASSWHDETIRSFLNDVKDSDPNTRVQAIARHELEAWDW
jgi:predicted NACHT family NTPase